MNWVAKLEWLDTVLSKLDGLELEDLDFRLRLFSEGLFEGVRYILFFEAYVSLLWGHTSTEYVLLRLIFSCSSGTFEIIFSGLSFRIYLHAKYRKILSFQNNFTEKNNILVCLK